ncbi:histidinol-phosphatase [Stappia sp. F7233]|uniref:Histidinol-phosphatase n=1 Tax=Stappia albiluteola TaxID=2758565 RepID=A0A839ADW4_9HYPH|nr:histidinol-phosphatase [Stappia albiluteola]MBA5777326.1 histidinol-phosphatase [Stappia albiluteola]
MADRTDLTAFMHDLADAATAAIMPHFRAAVDVENKEAKGFDPVTIADRAGEEAMRDLILKTYPSHGVLGEEHGNHQLDASHIWVLDPIDGTRAFITGLPTWGTLIGLNENGRASLGMMAQPFIGERFHGDGKEAWLQFQGARRQLRTRACSRIEDALMCTTDPRLFMGGEQPVFKRIEQATRNTRYGTDCYGFSMVAAGQVDLVIETGLKPYDIVALIPIIEGAGGVVTDWSGGRAEQGGQVVASGDPRLHEKVLRELATA